MDVKSELGLDTRQPFHFICKQNAAIAAQLVGLAIDILNSAAVMHDAGMFLTVAQVECMAQFMSCFFDDTLDKVWEGAHFQAFIKPVCGDNAGLAAELGFSVNMGQYGNEQVDPGYGQDLDGIGGRQQGQLFKDQGRVVLFAAGIQGKPDILKQGLDFGAIAEEPLDIPADQR